MEPQSSVGRLSLVLARTAETLDEPEFVAEPPLVSFGAHLADARVFGWVRLHASRLTDLLNQHSELRLVNAIAEHLPDGDAVPADEVTIAVDDLVAVQAAEPRGDVTLRQHTRAYPLAVQCGCYLIGGFVHVPAGWEPLAHIEARPRMIPLTSAWIEFWADGRRRRQWIGTIIFNRDRTDSIARVPVLDGGDSEIAWPRWLLR